MQPIEFSDEAEQALASLIGTLRSGCEADFTTRLVNDRTENGRHGSIVQKALGRAKMCQDISEVISLDSLPDPLRRAEHRKVSNWGTMSRRPPFSTDVRVGDSLYSQVLKYFLPRKACTFSGSAMRYADGYVSSLYSAGRLGKLRPYDLDTASTMFHPTGLGFPVVSSDAKKHFAHVLSISREIWDSGGDLEWVTVLLALAGYRGQPLGPPSADLNPGGFAKTRFIYMMPRALTNLEKCIQAPLLQALRSNSIFCAWDSVHSVDVEMTRLLSSGRRILSIDFSKFDQSVPFEVIDRVYAIIRSWFVQEAGPLVDFCQEVFKRVGIIIPDISGIKGDYEVLPGSMRSGGVPSGSVMTNLVDSLVNAWVMAYAAKRLHDELLVACFQGDDGAIAFRNADSPSMADLAGVLSEDLGMTLSAHKSVYEIGEVTFLQNVHWTDYRYGGLNVGVRPILHAANSMGSHEKVDSQGWVGSDYETIRFCQQASYCLHHPSVTQFCDWLADNDAFARDVLSRVKNDPEFYLKACEAVRRKDSNGQKGFSPQSLWSSPVFQYMLDR